MGPLFLLCLSLILAAIATLYIISRTDGLHQSPFVFRRHLSIFQAAANFAPYSIIPTILAVAVKLWFGAIGESLKRLQPYISMLKGPKSLSDCVLVEYANAPIALITVKAIRHSHLILALVGVGALATEACKLSILIRTLFEIIKLIITSHSRNVRIMGFTSADLTP